MNIFNCCGIIKQKSLRYINYRNKQSLTVYIPILWFRYTINNIWSRKIEKGNEYILKKNYYFIFKSIFEHTSSGILLTFFLKYPPVALIFIILMIYIPTNFQQHTFSKQSLINYYFSKKPENRDVI